MSCPSLGKAPILNPATGCVRPLGSPHASGGQSILVKGNLLSLLFPSTTQNDLKIFLESIKEQAGPLAEVKQLDDKTLKDLRMILKDIHTY